jgi:DtxR family Mn-dependent transcriptional regulator
MAEEVTSQTEEFLESVYRLQERNGTARTSQLVRMLKVVPGTVTNTVERLEKKGLLMHKAYKGVELTEKGRKIAIRVLRRHRLSERLLMDVLRMEWNKVHEAACRLEHGVTDEVANKIERTLEWPRTCPHGNPIPKKCGGTIEEDTRRLSELNPGEREVVVRITDEKSSTLQRVERLGLKPGACVEVLEKASRGGSVIARIDETDCAVSVKIASVIRVKALGEGAYANSGVEEWSSRTKG